MPSKQRVLIIGAGIIGICSAIQLQRKGFKVIVTDPEPPGSMTSYGNAGALAVTEVMPLAGPGVLWQAPRWLLDPLGPLAIRWRYLPWLLPWLWRFLRAGSKSNIEHAAQALAALLRPTYDDYKPLLRDAGIADILIERGALTVYRSQSALARDALEWDTKRAYGIRCEPVDAATIKQLEPALAEVFTCGMFTPDWSHVLDPHRVVTALAELFQREGGIIQRNRISDFDFKDNQPTKALIENGAAIAFDQVVIAAGAWSKPLTKRLGYRVPLESERGYNTTLANPGAAIDREVIFAEDKFVITPMAMGLRIGGAAEFAGLESPPNYQRCKALLKLAQRYIPDLNPNDGQEWMGHRPTLPDSLPIISRSPRHSNVLFAFGHSHLGLTQGATSGRLIAMLAANEPSDIDLQPFRIDRF